MIDQLQFHLLLFWATQSLPNPVKAFGSMEKGQAKTYCKTGLQNLDHYNCIVDYGAYHLGMEIFLAHRVSAILHHGDFHLLYLYPGINDIVILSQLNMPLCCSLNLLWNVCKELFKANMFNTDEWISMIQNHLKGIYVTFLYISICN